MSQSGFRVYGEGHLADTLRCEIGMHRGLRLREDDGVGWSSVLAFVAQDVYDHTNAEQLAAVGCYLSSAVGNHQYVVVLSQVPPGWMRVATAGRQGVFYQADTIIVRSAVRRMFCPEQFIVGCANQKEPLPLVYQEYLAVHACPVLQMSYESAEMAKCAINYVLSRQIEATNVLASACDEVGADYDDVRAALHNDARIGPHAYLRPGELNQHLMRDVNAINKFCGGVGDHGPVC